MVLCEFLRKLDYFGVFPTLRVKNEDEYRSRFGGGVFLFYIFASLLYLFLTLKDFLNREVIFLNYSISVRDDTSRINLTNSGLYFAFAVLHDNNTLPPPILSEYLVQYAFLTNYPYSNTSTKYKKSINLTKCEVDDFHGLVNKDLFESIRLPDFYCPEMIQDSYMKGTFAEELFQYFEFELSVNPTIYKQKNASKALEFIENYLISNPLKVLMIWTDTATNSKELETPLTGFLKSYSTYVDFASLKKINFDFSPLNYTTDKNWILRKPESRFNVTFYDCFESSLEMKNRLLLGDLGRKMIKFYMRSSQYHYVMERSYLKLQAYLAGYGALQSNLLMILYLLVKFFNRFRLEQMMVNKMFKFREHFKYSHQHQHNLLSEYFNFKHVIVKNKIPQKKAVRRISTIDVKKMSLIELTNEKLDSKEEKFVTRLETRAVTITSKSRDSLKPKIFEEKILGETKKPLNYSSIEIILSYFPCKRQRLRLKTKLLKKALLKLEYYFDVFTYVRKLQEVDILKYLLLDENQTKVFKYLCKPTLSINFPDSDLIYQEPQNNRHIKSKIKLGEINEVIEAHKKIKEASASITNQRLLYLFEYDMNHLLK